MRRNQQKNSAFSQLGLSKWIFDGLLRNSVDLKASHFLNSFVYLNVPSLTTQGVLLALPTARSFMCSVFILQQLVSTSTCQALF